MDNHKAKFLLQAYRPDGSDARDPDLREALQQAERDPELAAWLQRERAFDEAFCQKLAEVPVPPHLKEEILAGQKVIHLPSWWQRPLNLSAVAAMLVVAVVVYLVFASSFTGGVAPAQAVDWTHFQQNAVQVFKQSDFSLKKATANSEEARAWLAEHGAPRDFVLPAGMRHMPTMGCTTFEMDGHPVSLICFKMPSGQLAHLFMTKRKCVRSCPPEKAPVFKQKGDYATASWSEGDMAMMLASKTSMPQLQQLFGGAPLTLLQHGHP